MENQNNTTFGQKIRALRKQNGWTQIEFAERLGCTQGIVTAYETDKKYPATKRLEAIADLFQIPVSDLLGEHPLPAGKEINPKYLKRLEQLETLSPSDRRAVFRMIDGLIAQSQSGEKKEE